MHLNTQLFPNYPVCTCICMHNDPYTYLRQICTYVNTYTHAYIHNYAYTYVMNKICFRTTTTKVSFLMYKRAHNIEMCVCVCMCVCAHVCVHVSLHHQEIQGVDGCCASLCVCEHIDKGISLQGGRVVQHGFTFSKNSLK